MFIFVFFVHFQGSKFNNSGVEIIQRTLTQPFDLQILHPKRQPHGKAVIEELCVSQVQ